MPWRGKEGTGKACREDPGPPHASSEIFLTKRPPAARPAGPGQASPRGKAMPRRRGSRIKSAACPLPSPRSARPVHRFHPLRSVSVAPNEGAAPRDRGRVADGDGFVSRWAGVWTTDRSGRLEMMEEGAPDLRQLVRLPDVLVVCSSTGWTDEKHMLYLQLLEETFVRQLHESGCSFKGLFNRSPRYCRRMKSSKQIIKYTTPDQGCCAIVEGEKVKSCIKAEHVESPSCCGNQQDEKVRSMEDNASTTEPVEEATSHARAASPGHASICYVGKHRHSPSRSAEGSDQNFDEETLGTGESRRGCNRKRLKSADGMRDHQVVLVVKAETHQVGCLDVSDKNSDNCSASSKGHAGLLDVEAGSPSGNCKDHGPK